MLLNLIVKIGSANTSSPADEMTKLVKYFKENLSRIQSYYQKFVNEKNIDKARYLQQVHQQMVQFINNPTMESIGTARNIRELLERAVIKQKIER